MPNCKSCGEWFDSSQPEKLCTSCERALKRLGKFVAPVLHGRWIGEEVCIETDNIFATLKECSVCHRIRPVDAYCSHCGAKMDEEISYGT